MYKINPEKYNGIFVMPSEIADKHLKMASEPMLKTVIFAMRHADTVFDEKDVAAGTGLSEEAAKDGLDYWTQAGILSDGETVKEVLPQKSENDVTGQTRESEPEKKTAKKLNPGMMNREQIAARIAESSIVRELFREAQEKLCRTIGLADQSALLNLHDFYGMPIEIILAICEYACSHGKSGNISYIYKVGVDWSEREIDTIEAADAEFRKLESLNSLWTDFCKITGVKSARPTANQQKYLNIWTGEWKFSLNMLSEAYEIMSGNTDSVSFPYMNKILAAWHSAGAKTPEEARELQKKFEREKEEKALKKAAKNSAYKEKESGTASSKHASYDIKKATELMYTTVPKYKKKGE